MIKIFVRILLLIFLTPVFAAADGVVTVNIIHSTPFGYHDSANLPTGTHWDYIQAIAERSGVEMVAHLIPRARLVRNLSDGSCDAAILFYSPSRENSVTYVAPIRKIRMVAINRKGLPLKVYEHLYSSGSIGLMQDIRITPRFDTDPHLAKEPKTSYDQMVHMLINNRLDTIVGNAVALSHAIDQWDAGDDVERPGLTLCTKEQWFQFSNKSPHLDKIDRIRDAMAELKAEGVFDAILTRYVGRGWQAINQ